LGAELHHVVWDDESAQWENYDACLIRTTWDYTDKQEAFVKWAHRAGKLIPMYNPAEIVEWNTNKQYLHELAMTGIPVAPTLWLDAGSEVRINELMEPLGWERAFIKPVVGATARETLRFDTNELGLATAQRHISRLLPTEGLMIQPYLESVETEGEYSVIFIDGAITHTIVKVPVAGDYRVQDDWGASDRLVELPDEVLGLAERVLDTVDQVVRRQQHQDEPLLYARVDFLRDNKGRFVLNELELVEPSLFFRHSGAAAARLAEALMWRIS